MIRAVVALGLAGHGLIHLIGFIVPWQIARLDGFSRSTSILWGQLDVGDNGARFLGAVWLAVAIGFVIAAVGIADRASWALTLALGVAVASLVVCVLGSPAASAGAVIDLAIMAGLVVDRRRSVDRSRGATL